MKNIGSILKIYYALASNIVSITDPDEDNTVQVSFAAGKTWTELVFTPETASFSEDEDQQDPGPLITQSLSCRFPKVGTTGHALLQAMRDQDLVLMVTDGNQVSYLVGTRETPVRMTSKVIRPQGAAGYNGYELSFTCKTIDNAPFIDESFVMS
jgi:hypothetical protein